VTTVFFNQFKLKLPVNNRNRNCLSIDIGNREMSKSPFKFSNRCAFALPILDLAEGFLEIGNCPFTMLFYGHFLNKKFGIILVIILKELLARSDSFGRKYHCSHDP